MNDRRRVQAITIVATTALTAILLALFLIPGPFHQCRDVPAALIDVGQPLNVLACEASWWPIGSGPRP